MRRRAVCSCLGLSKGSVDILQNVSGAGVVIALHTIAVEYRGPSSEVKGVSPVPFFPMPSHRGWVCGDSCVASPHLTCSTCSSTTAVDVKEEGANVPYLHPRPV